LAAKAKQANRESYTKPTETNIKVSNQTKPDQPYEEYDIPLEALIPPEFADVITSPVQQNDSLLPFELDIVRILLNYGTYLVRTKHIETDQEDNDEVKDVEVSVIELIIHEIEKDEITFNHPTLKLIYDEFKAGIQNQDEKLYKSDRFVRHENQEISRLAAEIITTKYELSPNWSIQKVRISTELDKLDRAVLESIYAFKNAKILHDMKEMQEKINELYEIDSPESEGEIMMLLSEIQKLNTVKLSLSDKLGRTII
jgi:DNA primase